jgi:hypothetical protein
MRRYTVITPLAVPGRREPLPPGSPVEMDETAGDKLVAKGILAPAKDHAAESTTDTAVLESRIRTLEEQLADAQSALLAQVEVTEAVEERARQAETQRFAAEARAQHAEAGLVALRAHPVAPPVEPPPPQEPPPEAKKTAKAK